MTAVLLALALVVYDNCLNLWPPFNGWLYVPLNLAATGVLAALAFGPLDLSLEELGLAGPHLWPAALGLGLALLLVAALLGVARVPRAARLIADRRVAHLRGGALAYQTLIRIPLGTALLEEFAFRGVLFVVFGGGWNGALASSISFGLWHVTSTLNLVRANRPRASFGATVGAVAGAVAFTTLAGLVFVWLRVSTGSLAAPFALHATVNSIATLAGVGAARRL